jgi:hypothetical protein
MPRRHSFALAAALLFLGIAGAGAAPLTATTQHNGGGPFPFTRFPLPQPADPQQLLNQQHGTFGNTFGIRPLPARRAVRVIPREGPGASDETERPLGPFPHENEARVVPAVAPRAGAAFVRVTVFRPTHRTEVVESSD